MPHPATTEAVAVSYPSLYESSGAALQGLPIHDKRQCLNQSLIYGRCKGIKGRRGVDCVSHMPLAQALAHIHMQQIIYMHEYVVTSLMDGTWGKGAVNTVPSGVFSPF